VATGAARQHLVRSMDEYPLAAVLVAGLVGYGLGYLVHSGWQSGSWKSRLGFSKAT